MKLNEECIASLDALGFDWRLNDACSYTPFEERIENLRIHREKHGNLNVKFGEDNSLADFCAKIRHSRKNPGQVGIMKLNEERIASLDAVGFVWRLNDACSNKSFEERIEDLRIHRAKYGNLNVKLREDRRLAEFCTKIRYARKNPGQAGIMRLN